MTKKIISWLSLVAVFIFLYSCRQELLQTEQENALLSQNITVKRLYKEQLQKEYAPVLERLRKFSGKKSSVNGKIYTDTENNFSIDTDNAYLVDNGSGTKTYTFFIDRNTPGKLENLVLKDLGNNLFDAYIIKYDNALLEMVQKPDVSQLKNYMDLSYLGQKTGNDIFSKIVSCYDFVPLQTIYVGGTECTGHDHHTNPADCPCGTSANCTPPVPGHYETTYGWISFSCDDGTWDINPGVGGSVTVPMGGGGVYTSGTDPCTFLRNILSKKFVDPPNATINDATTLLDQHLPATNPQNDGTKELTILASIIANSNDVQLGQFQSNGSETGEVTNSIPPALKYVFIGHDHPATSDLSTFSLSDLYYVYTLIKKGNVDSNTLFYVTTAHGTKYAFRITDLISFESWATGFFVGWEAELLLPPNMQKPRIESTERDYAIDVDADFSSIENEIGFLRFFDKKMLFLEMYKLENIQWNRISYNSISDNVKKTPCN
ncbi:MAG TPA: hypothetical protein DIW37_14300 [Chryseobacterium sp.]|nr:hypothetical protein [Chryseobacterium sp.]